MELENYCICVIFQYLGWYTLKEDISQDIHTEKQEMTICEKISGLPGMPHVCWPKAIQDLVMIISIALMTVIRMIGGDIETDEYPH